MSAWLLRKWLARLPHPIDRHDRAAGYRYQASILQGFTNKDLRRAFAVLLGKLPMTSPRGA